MILLIRIDVHDAPAGCERAARVARVKLLTLALALSIRGV
jgi:hypothetical protein